MNTDIFSNFSNFDWQFIQACEQGDINEVEICIKKISDYQSIKVLGFYALRQTVTQENSYLDVVKCIIECPELNKFINEWDIFKVLNLTAQNQHLDIFKYLVEHPSFKSKIKIKDLLHCNYPPKINHFINSYIAKQELEIVKKEIKEHSSPKLKIL